MTAKEYEKLCLDDLTGPDKNLSPEQWACIAAQLSALATVRLADAQERTAAAQERIAAALERIAANQPRRELTPSDFLPGQVF